MPIPRLLQFNYESTVSYDDSGYSTLSVKGTLEIPLTRDPTQATRTFTQTADDLRGEIERRVMSGIDLQRFRMVRRNFQLSRDKRRLEWDFQAEEKPYMDLPFACNAARGTYNVRPAKAGMGLATWLCTLRATYTVVLGQPRRMAWLAFLALLRKRMAESRKAPNLIEPTPPRGPKPVVLVDVLANTVATPVRVYNQIVSRQQKAVDTSRKAWLIDFSFDEGLYLDSKTTTFSATWKLVVGLSHVMLASGLWTKVEGDNRELWATTIKTIQGVQSWLPDKMGTDIIVDFGGGDL